MDGRQMRLEIKVLSSRPMRARVRRRFTYRPVYIRQLDLGRRSIHPVSSLHQKHRHLAPAILRSMLRDVRESMSSLSSGDALRTVLRIAIASLSDILSYRLSASSCRSHRLCNLTTVILADARLSTMCFVSSFRLWCGCDNSLSGGTIV